MSSDLRIGALGFVMIAVCYGFARFAFGLFLPQIDAELELGSTISGVISGGSFAGYCIAIVASAVLSERLGARAVATAAAAVAAVGMAGIALAPTPLLLAVAVLVAGSSTGLASPPMAAAVEAVVRKDRQDLTNTVINAGTSAGVTLSGLVALAMVGQWRIAFGLFAAIAFLLTLASARWLPTARRRQGANGSLTLNKPLLQLIAASFLMGAASTAVWSFGGKIVSEQLDWDASSTGWLWACLGAGGTVGACAGSLVRRFGVNRVHLTFLGLMSAAILAVGSGTNMLALALAGGAMFGTAYVMLTGVYLVWGVGLLPHRPATGLMIGFLTIAVGQTCGAPVFGLLMAEQGMSVAITGFVGLALVAGLFRYDAGGKFSPNGQ